MKRESKKKVIASHSTHAKDTGSSQVQVAILTERINELSQHLETHPKDDHSRRGLLKQVAKRRRLLNFLLSRSEERYRKLIDSLGLSK